MAFTFQVNSDIKFNHDEKLLAKAESFRPKIHTCTVKPLRLVELTYDAAKLKRDGREARRRHRIIIDFGRHIVGKFSVNISKVLRCTFG